MYTFESRIRYSETDVTETLKLEALIDYFQDCSSFQSEDVGVGFSFMREHHVAWIVNYWQIDINRLPSFGEKIRIGTSPYGFKGFIGLRNFMMETIEGERLANANSVWSLFDLEKGFPVRVLPEMIEAYTLYPKFDMEYLPRKIKVPEAGSLRNFSEITVTEDMLDSNHHVNNGQYVRIAMNILQEMKNIHRIRVEYLAQAHLGDVIVPQICQSKAETIVSLQSGLNKKPYATVEVQ